MTRNIKTGVLFVLLFNLLSSAKVVYVAHLIQETPAVLVMELTIGVMAIFFFALQARTLSSFLAKIKKEYREVLLLNISTAMSWVTFFFAVKYLEPAVSDTIVFAVGPIMTAFFWRILRPQSPVTKQERWAAIGVAVGLLFLGFNTIQGNSAVGTLSLEGALLGLLNSVVGGFGVAFNTIYSKRLSDNGMRVSEIMGCRFFLLLVVGILLWPNVEAVSFNPEFAMSILIISFLGLIIPLYLIQMGIERCEPITVSLLLALIPAISFVFQTFDWRLEFSELSLIGITISLAFTLIGIRSRFHRRLT